MAPTVSVCAAWTREQWAAALPQPIPAEVALGLVDRVQDRLRGAPRRVRAR